MHCIDSPSAPEKPPSAYVTFSNDVREDVKDKSFTEIARIVGDRWKQLDEPTKAVSLSSKFASFTDGLNPAPFADL